VVLNVLTLLVQKYKYWRKRRCLRDASDATLATLSGSNTHPSNAVLATLGWVFTTQFTCFTVAGVGFATQFICFTSTKVQILTQKDAASARADVERGLSAHTHTHTDVKTNGALLQLRMRLRELQRKADTSDRLLCS
jgi:hypothetical protein